MSGRLTNKQYTQLSEAISLPRMETIAQGYLDMDPENIASIKHENFYQAAQSNRAMVRRWANKTENSGPDQTKSEYTHTLTHSHTHTLEWAGADPGFPVGGGTDPPGGGDNIGFCQNFQKTA